MFLFSVNRHLLHVERSTGFGKFSNIPWKSGLIAPSPFSTPLLGEENGIAPVDVELGKEALPTLSH